MTEMAILGFGTVGSGVAKVIDKNQEAICAKYPEGLHVKYILDLRDFPESSYADRVVHDFDTVIDDPEIKVICETMGGLEPAYSFTKRALEKGISVCTSNKELVAAHGPSLLKLARKNHCSYLFEASVGGGIPIIRPLATSLAQEKITSIIGILNGTTNYILSRMEAERADFEEMLAVAQEKGYAERNPEADVEGHDCCRKIAILSSLMCGKTVRYEDIPCEGVTGITALDFAYAKKMHMSIKLLGISRRNEKEGTFYVITAPFLVPEDHPLHSVSGVYNAVCVHGNMVGDLMFYGQGAGKYPTASAVVADVIDAAGHQGKTVGSAWSDETVRLTDINSDWRRMFVRVDISERTLAEELFGDDIVEVHAEAALDEFAFMTAPISEEAYAERAAQLTTVKSRIRVLEEK